MAIEATATWLGGYRTEVTARQHAVIVDEPASDGGEDTGMMPTELFCASLASCFCLALGHVARKRSRDLPGLRVTVRAHRPGRELRYERLEIEAAADISEADLVSLLEPARRVCWVSNTLSHGVELRYTTVDGRTRR